MTSEHTGKITIGDNDYRHICFQENVWISKKNEIDVVHRLKACRMDLNTKKQSNLNFDNLIKSTKELLITGLNATENIGIVKQ